MRPKVLFLAASIGGAVLGLWPGCLRALTVPSIDGAAVGASSGNNSSFSLTITGGSSSNRVLVLRVLLDTHTQNLVSGATWNGVALTRFYSTMVPTYNTDGDYEVWYLVAPATGSNDLVVQWGGTFQTYNLSYAFYRDASQVAPLGAVASNPVQSSAGTYSSSIYTQAADSLVSDVLCAGAWNGSASIVQGAGQNVEYARNVGGPIDIFGDNLATGANGAYNLAYTLGSNSDLYWSSQTLEIQAVPAVQSVWRINCGGPAYTDSQSQLWSADTGYSDGFSNTTTTAQTGTLDPTLYQSERFRNPSVDYSLTVPAGSYQVTLKFAEVFDCCAGQRFMNLSINGGQVLAGLDVAGEVGIDYPDDKVFNNIAPVGGQIAIQAAGATGSPDLNAKISAIQIIPQPVNTPTWTPTTVVPVCAAWSLTGSAFASGAGVTLTANLIGETGGAWNVAKVDLGQSFNWSFKAYFGSPGGADGIDFVLQNDPRGLTALALDGGAAKGYSGSGLITPSFAFDLEDFGTNGRLQPEENGNPTALCGDAGMPCPYIFTRPIDDSMEHAYQVVWDAPAKTLTLIVDGVARLSYGRDLVGAVFGGVSQVYWGFTAATGGASNLQYVYEVGCTAPSPTATVTLTATPTITFTVTPTDTPTSTPSVTFSPTPTPTDTPTDTPTATVTLTATPTITFTDTPTVTPTDTPSDTPTATVTATATPTITFTATPTDTPTATPSVTFSPSPTSTATVTDTPSDTETVTYTDSPTDTDTPTVTPTDTPSVTYSPSATSTPTPSSSPTPSATLSDTLTSSPTSSITPTVTDTPTATPTISPTPSVTLTATPTTSPKPSPTPTVTPSFSVTESPTLTVCPTPSATLSPSRTRTVTRTVTPSLTPTATPTAGTVKVTLWVYDSGGLLLREIQEGSTSAPLTGVSLDESPYDPGQGPLLMGNAVWSGSFDGKDASGAILRNGYYLLDLRSSQGGADSDLKLPLQVLGSGGGGLTVEVAPNPAGAGGLVIRWSPAQAADLSVHSLDGGLVRDFGRVAPPQRWDLKGAGGQDVGAGVYVVGVRLPGQRRPHFFKVAVLR